MKAHLLEKLREIPLFHAIRNQPEELEKLEKICDIRTVNKDQVIFLEGDSGNEMFIPVTGEVEILKRTRDGDNYTVTRLNASEPIFFGELALVDDERRSATVLATTEGECLVISKKSFLEFGDKYPEIALPITRAIAQTLASRLRKTTADMLTLFDALVNEVKN